MHAGWREDGRAYSIAAFAALIQGLARIGLGDAAERLCCRAIHWFPRDDFATTLAFVKSYRGDLEGAIRQLSVAMPQREAAPMRAVFAGTFCEHNRQPQQAVEWFERAIAAPSPFGQDAAVRTSFEERIRRLRETP
jgi:hypothetical protein